MGCSLRLSPFSLRASTKTDTLLVTLAAFSAFFLIGVGKEGERTSVMPASRALIANVLPTRRAACKPVGLDKFTDSEDSADEAVTNTRPE